LRTFGGRLKKLRENKKLTQKQLAQILKVGMSTISMYERDEREPSFEMISTLADYFSVDFDYLMGRSDYPTTTDNETSIDPEWAKIFEIVKAKGAEIEATTLLRSASQLSKNQLTDFIKIFDMIAKKGE